MKRRTKVLLSLTLIIAIYVFVYFSELYMDPFIKRILNTGLIYAILGVSLNLINGFTGQFSLGHAGFMAIGAYASALLYMSPETKMSNFFMIPLISPLDRIQIPFFWAIIIGGLMAAGAGFIVGAPCLRVRGDYLAIVTYGFSEIIRSLFNNLQNITNGPLGLKGLPTYTNLWWTVSWTIITVIVIKRIVDSSYGRALKAIRDDEIAAENLGINLFKHKVLAFVVGSFFAGIAGGLLGSLLMTIDPNSFSILFTYQIIMIILLGGLGNITGSVVVGIGFAFLMEWLRFVEMPMNIFGIEIPGILGMRMLIFSILLMVTILFFRQGIFGKVEFSWEGVAKLFQKKKVKE
ncbi:MAG TPA: branched-chain amino acid ABC transporter permease [Fervidobacterium sp.]|nr:branched-chain amino acid ABC transporter permease [Fervidobacterium sp.]HOK33757.1 branched-chain amino acid ABC transporter permease [Fervidobacterium sp.]HOL03838.1 branched-chain amino acid ABC transporter permease [Fervidobacterium sp.]HOS52748.1 branched-chain amino acid ABC transporter permease [Fervidobacterium sp.]HPC80057.1 branched-chain amino acid ABC transporter permease [Fervidobacterium sp.]